MFTALWTLSGACTNYGFLSYKQFLFFFVIWNFADAPRECLPEIAWMIDAFYNQSSADLDLWCLVHTRHTPMWFDWDWWRTFRWICQCAVDGLLLTFCVYLQRHAHLAQLSQLSLGRQLIQSWRRLTGDCILSNSSSTNSIILPVLFFVSPSLPPSVHSFSSLLWVYKYRKDIHGGVLNIPRQTLTSLKSSSLLDSLELHFILFIHSDNKLFVI